MRLRIFQRSLRTQMARDSFTTIFIWRKRRIKKRSDLPTLICTVDYKNLLVRRRVRALSPGDLQ